MTDTPADDLVERLNEAADTFDGAAWRDRDGGQKDTMTAALLREAAAALSRYESPPQRHDLREQALTLWDAARATLESGDRSDLSRLQIEDAFAVYEGEIARLAAALSRRPPPASELTARLDELRAYLISAAHGTDAFARDIETLNLAAAALSRAEAQRDALAEAVRIARDAASREGDA